MYAIYGVPGNTSVVYAHWRDAVIPEDREKAEATLAESVKNKVSSFNQFRINHPVLGIRFIQAAEEIVLDENNDVFSVVGVNQDVTERKQMEESLRLRDAEITLLSLTDPLTGLGNRRKLDEYLVRELARFKRGGHKLAVIFADLDHFKTINDRYGHELGDMVLKSFARLINSQIRENDLAARFGGEEFVILMPDADENDAVAMAERFRSSIARTTMAPLNERVTASFGVAEMKQGQSGADLLRSADRALYMAKADGRNRVMCESHRAPTISPMKKGG
jgi:diguanylate cyclase (GGDEF)-like protein